MHSVALIGLLCASAIRAGVTPTAPGPGQSFNEGADCPIQWNLDTTGKWTSFSIDLMSGSNTAMTLVTNVASGLDGTKGDTSHTWPCPNVTPNSAIYFYQFSQAGADTTWTTRFQIASASGASTPPSNTAQPDGKNIPWGTGHLEGASAPTTTASTKPAANTSTTTTPTTNSSTSTTSGSTFEATSATNSTTTNSTSSMGTTTTTTPSAGASTFTGTASSSGVTPKLIQSPSTASQNTAKGSSGSSSGSTASPTSGASSLVPISATFAVVVFATMVFSA